jgi:UrcA family protein
MGKKIRNIGVSLLLVFGFALPLVGSAASPSEFEDTSERVSYADLDINSAAGAKILYSRLKLAAEKACGVELYLQHRSFERIRIANNCYREALSDAVDSIDSEALTKVHAG